MIASPDCDADGAHARDVVRAYLPIAVQSAAFGIVAFVYLFDLLLLLGVSGKPRDGILFLSGAMLLGPLCGITSSFWSAKDSQLSGRLTALAAWTAVAVLVLLIVLQHLAWVFAMPAVWSTGAMTTLAAVPAAHLAVAIFWLLRPRTPPARIEARIPVMVFGVVLAVSVICLFWFEPGGRQGSGLIAFLTSAPFASAQPGGAAIVAVLSLVACAGVIVLASRELKSGIGSWVSRSFLAVSFLLVVVLCFDFSITLEVLHYLTNVGPAQHLRHGGVLFVDTFSQYGAGPILATYVGYLLGPLTLGTAQVVVQVFNIAFLVVWLLCLYRMSPARISATVLGLLAIALQLATWNFGDGNINVAPSILGLRHLPMLVLVLGISLLRPPSRHSAMTLISMFVATLWSLESFVGTLGVYAGFVAFLDWRDRKLRRMLLDLGVILLSVGAAFVAASVYTLSSAGSWPRVDLYLGFFGEAYNPLSEMWAYPASTSFFAWITPMLAVIVVLACATRASFGTKLGEHCNDALHYRFVPMALSIVPIAAYFAFRSYDYTLFAALLPTAALLIATALPATVALRSRHGAVRWLAAIPVTVLAGAMMYSIYALGRADGPYSLLLHECRDHGRCTPSAILTAFEARIALRDVLEPTGNLLSDRWIPIVKPAHAVNEALDLIQANVSDRDKVTLLLGNQMATETTLLYADKGQYYPLSFTYTDQLVPAIAHEILTARVRLPDGSIVVVGERDALSALEADLWARIQREYKLCPIPAPTLSAFRVASVSGCTGR